MPGSLTAVGLLNADGEISALGKQAFRDDVVAVMLAGGAAAPLLGLDNPIPIVLAISAPIAPLFAHPADMAAHKERYPQWHSMMIEGLYQPTAQMFDKINAEAVLTPIFFDPTYPIVMIINLLLESIQALIALIQQIPDLIMRLVTWVIQNIVDFIAAIIAFFMPLPDVNALVQWIIEKIMEFLATLGAIAQAVIDYITEKIEEIIALIIEKIFQPILDWLLALFAAFALPPIPPLPLPLLNIPQLSLSLPDFNFDLSLPNFRLPDISLFLNCDLPGPGVICFIIKLITGIVEIVLMLIAAAAEWIMKILEGIMALVLFLIEWLFLKILELLEKILPPIVQMATLCASIMVFISRLIPMIIVSLIGYLIGPGLIIQMVAMALGLI